MLDNYSEPLFNSAPRLTELVSAFLSPQIKNVTRKKYERKIRKHKKKSLLYWSVFVEPIQYWQHRLFWMYLPPSSVSLISGYITTQRLMWNRKLLYNAFLPLREREKKKAEQNIELKISDHNILTEGVQALNSNKKNLIIILLV